MKRRGYTLAKRFPLILGLVVFPLSVVSETQARSAKSMPGRSTMAVFYLDNHSGINLSNVHEIKTRLQHLLLRNARLDPKLLNAPSKDCGCAPFAPQEAAGGFMTCMKNCMADAGVSAYSILMCSASCAASETGIGAIVCAICVGASITVVEVCAMGCASHGGKGFGELMDARAVKQRHATSGSWQAKLRLQPTRLKS